MSLVAEDVLELVYQVVALLEEVGECEGCSAVAFFVEYLEAAGGCSDSP